MASYVFDTKIGKFVEKSEYYARKARNDRSDFPTPAIRSDDLGLNGIWCPSDGERYDSKSAYYAAVKSTGGEIIGGDEQAAFGQPMRKEYKPEGIVDDIKKAMAS